MAKSKKYIGIDIGGSKTNIILFSDNQVIKKTRFQTPRNRNELYQKLLAEVGPILNGAKGIGVGIAGVVDSKNGKVLIAPNLRFLNDWQVSKILKNKFGVPIRVDNDARCFLRAESKLGTARNFQNVIGLTLGTGIGSGLMINGKIYYGANNSAGESGHIIIDALKSWENLVKAARIKDAFEKISRYLGIGLANLVNILNPEAIIIGGGWTNLKTLLPAAKKVMKKYILNPKAKKIKMLNPKFGEDAPAIGAALLF